MKYGETLRQRSIAAWSHYNIDYDDIKYFIKEHTTPGKGKTISVPGRPDEKLAKLENDLFRILEEQHQRIDLFVKSKAGEVQRRLG
jgi:SPX domain protein involved in polyphosphate accumulation